jgi:hypothetical protein
VSNPLVTPQDLGTYLADDSIDQQRAAFMLQLAQDLCESIVSPVPATANGVVLAVAARAFSNPEGVTAETVGPYSVQRASAGLYLTRSDKATLRRLAGGSGAFSIDVLPTGTSAVQLVAVSGSPTGGTFTLNFAGLTTTPLAYNASSSAILAALCALGTIGAGNVTVSGIGSYLVTFVNDLATTPVPTLIADGSLLTGGTSPAVTVTVVTTGVLAPGQDLPGWDFDYSQSSGYDLSQVV